MCPDSEGEWLSEWLEGMEEPEELSRFDNSSAEVLTGRYEANKLEPVKSTLKCPVCSKAFVKNSYQKAFCSNKGVQNCKDKFWNSVREDRFERAKYFAK